MTKPKLPLIELCVCVALITFLGNARAQQVSLAVRSGKPMFQSLSLNGDDKRKMFFNVGSVGSIKGRIFSDPEVADNVADEYGVGGVKVTLRSTDQAFAYVVMEQYTNNAGAYYFQDLQPGRYSIEIDPADVPVHFRIQNKSVSRMQ